MYIKLSMEKEMKYYCPECKSEYVVGEKLTAGYCTMLEDDGEECGEILIELPDFETPSQYEKRTGKKWNGAVYSKCRDNNCVGCDGDTWRLYISEFDAKEDICRNKTAHLLCANSPEPPPDDWRST